MEAITVKYLPSTATQPARLKAACGTFKGVTIPFPNELSGIAAYAEAAIELCDVLGWHGPLAGGWTGSGSAAFLLSDAAHVGNV